MIKSDGKKDNIITIIGEGTSIEGIISAKSSARVDGTLQGEAKFYKALIVGEKGYINGTVSAPHIIIYGKIEGQIKAETLEIKSAGTVTGDINVGTLNVESGGVFNGNSVMNALGSNLENESEKPEDNSAIQPVNEFKPRK